MTHGLMQHMRLLPVALASLLIAGCGGGGSSPDPGTETATTADPQAPVANACPAEGCRITIVNAERDGDEIAVTWETNFVPDISRNHIHIYWDIYTADEVSSDAEARGVSQGEWVPTDVVPTFVTQDVVAVAMRGESTTICVTTGDRDHVVIDATLVDCRDVADLL